MLPTTKQLSAFSILVFSALGLLVALAASIHAAPASAAVGPAIITVDVNQPGITVPGELWGSNFLQSAPYSQTIADASFISATRQISISLMRWPGGNNADLYDWKHDQVIKPGRRLDDSRGVNLLRLLQFARSVGAEPGITINFGTMNAQDAADLVEFLNGAPDSPWGAVRASMGFTAPVGVRFFEIGNEENQPHMWYYSWTAENPGKYFFGGDEERRGRYDNGANQDFDPLGSKGDFFKVDGGPGQQYVLRFPPVRNVRVLWAASEDEIRDHVYQEWSQVDDLSTQPADAKVFTLEAERGVLHFGDGVHGAIPPSNSYFLVEYTTYGHDGFLDFVQAMRAVSSSVPIKIGAATLPFSDTQPITDTAGMQAIFNAMDFFVRHQYNASFDYSNYDSRRQIATERVEHLTPEKLPAYLQSIGISKTLPAAISEWNIFLDTAYWRVNRTLEGGVIAAEWFMRLLNAGEAAPVLYANQFALHGGNLALIRTQTNHSLAPMAYVFEAFAPWWGSTVVSTTVESPTEPAADRPIPIVVATAARSPDGRTLRLAMVNNSASTTIDVRLQFRGFSPASARLWQLWAPDYEANNDHNSGTVAPQEQTLTPAPEQLTLPPHAVVFLTLVAEDEDCAANGCVQYLPLLTIDSAAAERSRFGITRTSNFFDCGQAAGIDAQATWVVIPWRAIEPNQDEWTFEQLDQLVADAEGCGVKLGLKLVTGQGHWGVGNATSATKGSLPPVDLADYQDWVTTTVNRYRGRVYAYAIENEVNARRYWDGTLAEYKPVWQAGYAAVKAGDPDAKVVDFGMTSQSYGVAIARELVQEGKAGLALQWYNRYISRRDFPPLASEDELLDMLASPEVQDDLTVMDWHFQMQPRPDIYQLHFYEAWDMLPPVMDWIKLQMAAHGGQLPIEAWEIGYAWHDDASYDPQAHARDVPKLLLSALGEGADRVYYLPYYSTRAYQGRLETVRALVDVNYQPRPAYGSYRQTALRIANFASATRMQAGPTLWQYRFDDTVVQWTADGDVVYSSIAAGALP